MKKGKLLAVLLAGIMMFGTCTGSGKAVKAAETTKTFPVKYKLDGETGLAPSPTETFAFEGLDNDENNGTAGVARLRRISYTTFNSGQQGTISVDGIADIPESIKELKLSEVQYISPDNEATQQGNEKSLNITIPDAENYPSTGYYFYKFREKAGSTAGVTYDTSIYYIRVAIVYDEASGKNKVEAMDVFKQGNGDNGTKQADITNTYKAGKLQINNDVTGNFSNAADTFDVTVTFTAPEGTTIKSNITSNIENKVSDITTTKSEDEKVITATFKVKKGTTVVFNNIPAGVTYSVEQTKGSGYDEPSYDEQKSGTIQGNQTISTTITNNRGVTIDTGVFFTNLPYILILAAAAAGLGLLYTGKKRRIDEE